jgi:hypothetical protein
VELCEWNVSRRGRKDKCIEGLVQGSEGSCHLRDKIVDWNVIMKSTIEKRG